MTRVWIGFGLPFAALVVALALAACGGDDGPGPTPTATPTPDPTTDTRAAPDACKLVTKAEVEAATKKPIASTQTGTKQRSQKAEDLASFCNFFAAGDEGTVVAQVTWGRPPGAADLFKVERPEAGTRDLPGLGTQAYQNSFGAGIILVGDSIISVAVPGTDQVASQAAMLALAQLAVRRVE